MNTFGHKFVKETNDKIIEMCDKGCCSHKNSGYYFCKICNVEIYFYGDTGHMYNNSLESGEMLTCDEMIVKKLLE